MNGRLYDPRLHRFLQPDNNLQEPYNTQNYNRYGYVLNNPLKYTDPSGEFTWSDLVSGLAIVAGAILVVVGGPAGVLLGYKLIGSGAAHFLGTAARLVNNGSTWDEASNYVGFNSPTIEIPTNLGGGGKKDVANNNNPVEVHSFVSSDLVDQNQQKSPYKPLTKSGFLDWFKNTSCQDCSEGLLQQRAGAKFENLFEEFVLNNNKFVPIRIQKNTIKFQGEVDYTVPDYVGIKYSARDAKQVEMTSFYELQNFYELKATKNNIGLGSFGGQIRTQIQAAKNIGVRELILVTTSNITLTQNLKNYAMTQNVLLTHYWAQYAFIGGKFTLNFVINTK